MSTQETASSQQAQGNIYTAEDIEKGKTMAGLAYLLFFLPLVACPESKYGRFHANQSLILLITAIAGNIILGLIPIIGWMLLPVFGIAVMVFAVMGLINGFWGKAKELPLIGKFTILK
ncbi:MAG: hypothetical protein GX915_09780 [Clostridiales bacterium]|nr:hypothetical protein [Clostridiales bacterium]